MATEFAVSPTESEIINTFVDIINHPHPFRLSLPYGDVNENGFMIFQMNLNKPELFC
ncbi:hypothetical protein PESHB4_20890 [Pediococcus ethanolidurans]|nr:hypothetical protein PET01_10450 [Pediococcus ethanolidurans]